MDNYIDQPMKVYVDDLAAHKDAPGGGSACGLTGSMAAALGTMVCHFTIGKKKYAEVEDRIKAMQQDFEAFRAKFTGLMQEDVDIFHSKMGTAFSLPKDTDEQKQARKAAIQEACKAASEPPMEMMRLSYRLMKLLDELAEKGSQQLVSDVGVAAALANGAFEGASYNVLINLKYLDDIEFIKKVQTELLSMIEEYACLSACVIEKVREKIQK
jgi:formiminotetrahydrofolate cyclodeaminase